MLIKYYTDYYNLDQVYKFNITDNKDWQTISIYFPNLNHNLKQEVIYLSSIKDKETYDIVVKYLMKSDVIEYNNLEQFFD